MKNRKAHRSVIAISGLVGIGLFAGWRYASADDADHLADENEGISYSVIDGDEPTDLPPEMEDQISDSVESFFLDDESDSGALDLAEVVDTRELVNVVLTIAQWSPATASVDVAGYIPNLDSGGICIAKFANSEGVSLEKQSFAFEDATTTVCSDLSLNKAELGSGTWSIVLGYQSGSLIGASIPTEIVIP